MEISIGGRMVRLDPSCSIGKGGEADVFRLDSDMVVKIFKPPHHPDYDGLLHEQAAAKERIAIHQKKLPAFPKNLPPRVVSPLELARNRSGSSIVGYAMPYLVGRELLIRYSDPSFRRAGMPSNTVVDIFRDMHQTVSQVHRAAVIIGDFNDLNILARGVEASFIDADSFQFDGFLCRVFTARFVDPLLCDPRASSPLLIKPHSADSDWYAFNVMLMQGLLLVNPYGGVYRPKDLARKIPHDARPLHRITIFHPEVKCPKVALPIRVLPDDLLAHFQATFEKDKRGPFPFAILENLRWTICSTCKLEHARGVCPDCVGAMPVTIKEVTQIRGKVTATQIFKTGGVILFAAMQNGKLLWLYHHQKVFKREDGHVVFTGDLDPEMRFRISGDKTLVGKGGRLVTFVPSSTPQLSGIDSLGNLPIFDANERHIYWLANGQLYRSDDILDSRYIGDVLSGQTLFWVGPSFGFGFYRAGTLSMAFVFDVEAAGINDNVLLPRLRGQLVDSTCAFGKDRCWFFVATHEGGKTIHQCFVIRRDGIIEASEHGEAGEDSWLGTIRGKCALGDSLFVARDDGIVRIKIDNGQLALAQVFPDTEPFVSANSHLFAGNGGLCAIGKDEIRLLKIS